MITRSHELGLDVSITIYDAPRITKNVQKCSILQNLATSPVKFQYPVKVESLLVVVMAR